jgi:hypothetical protein
MQLRVSASNRQVGFWQRHLKLTFVLALTALLGLPVPVAASGKGQSVDLKKLRSDSEHSSFGSTNEGSHNSPSHPTTSPDDLASHPSSSQSVNHALASPPPSSPPALLGAAVKGSPKQELHEQSTQETATREPSKAADGAQDRGHTHEGQPPAEQLKDGAHQQSAPPSRPGSPSSAVRQPSATTSAAERQARLHELSKDPDHGGQITEGSRREAEVALGLEESGRVAAPLRRPVAGEKGDFIDSNNKVWDVKGYQSRETLIATIEAKAAAKNKPAPKLDASKPIKGEFALDVALKQIEGEFKQGEGVMLDLKGLNEGDRTQLMDAVAAKASKDSQWKDRILFSE